LLEIMVSLVILAMVLGVAFSMFNISTSAAGFSSRSGQYVHDQLRTRDRLLRLLSEVPAVPGSPSFSSMPALPTGWPATTPAQSPHWVAGSGSTDDQLFFFTAVVRDLNGDGVIGSGEQGLGAAGVVGNYYRVHVVDDPTARQRQLVRDLVNGTTGAPDLNRREVLVHQVDDALTTGATADRKAFYLEHGAAAAPGLTDDRDFLLRIRQGFVFAGPSGREVVRKTIVFNVSTRAE
jgi:hypothetical protein